MTVFALYPDRKSVLEVGSYGSKEEDDLAVLGFTSLITEVDPSVIFYNVNTIEQAIAVCVWLATSAWIFDISIWSK